MYLNTSNKQKSDTDKTNLMTKKEVFMANTQYYLYITYNIKDYVIYQDYINSLLNRCAYFVFSNKYFTEIAYLH